MTAVLFCCQDSDPEHTTPMSHLWLGKCCTVAAFSHEVMRYFFLNFSKLWIILFFLSLFWCTSSHLCMNFMNKAIGMFYTWRALLINEIPWIGEGVKSIHWNATIAQGSRLVREPQHPQFTLQMQSVFIWLPFILSYCFKGSCDKTVISCQKWIVSCQNLSSIPSCLGQNLSLRYWPFIAYEMVCFCTLPQWIWTKMESQPILRIVPHFQRLLSNWTIDRQAVSWSGVTYSLIISWKVKEM